MRYRFLSYTIEERMPVYGGRASVSITPVRSIARKDTANVSSISLNNHWGTHIDLPRHFFNKGASVCDHPADFWRFSAPCVINLKLKPSELLRWGDWAGPLRKAHDIILFRSGWGRRRARKEYGTSNPGVHPEVADILRVGFPNARAIGIDWVSVSPYKDRAIGRMSHSAFLDPDGAGRPVAIIEDMDLSAPMARLSEVTVLPLRVEGIDSAPVTVLGAFRD
jgi:kynurenine formamidase